MHVHTHVHMHTPFTGLWHMSQTLGPSDPGLSSGRQRCLVHPSLLLPTLRIYRTASSGHLLGNTPGNHAPAQRQTPSPRCHQPLWPLSAPRSLGLRPPPHTHQGSGEARLLRQRLQTQSSPRPGESGLASHLQSTLQGPRPTAAFPQNRSP